MVYEYDEDEINRQIALLMESMPDAVSAKDLREREGVGTRVEWYSCHDAYSLKNWWRAEIGTDHNKDENGEYRPERDSAFVEWKVARNPIEDITDAWEVAETLKMFSIARDISGLWRTWAWDKAHIGAIAKTAPLAICLLALEIQERRAAYNNA